MDFDGYLERRDLGWYDKQGKPVNMMEWVELTKDPNYRIVQQTNTLLWRVSTVLLGLDHGHLFTTDPNYKPIIFETMVFTRWRTYRRGYCLFGIKHSGYWSTESVDEQRYCTWAQAKGGHLDMLEKWGGWNGFKRFIAYWLGLLGSIE